MTTLAPKRVVFPGGLCFSVVGDGGGRAALLAAHCHCSSKAWAAQVSGGDGGLFRAQSHEGGSGPGSREAGLQFRNWKNQGAGGAALRGCLE